MVRHTFPSEENKESERDLCKIVALPTNGADTWWTAACSVGDNFYKEDRPEKGRGQSKDKKLGPSFQPSCTKPQQKSQEKQERREKREERERREKREERRGKYRRTERKTI